MMARDTRLRPAVLRPPTRAERVQEFRRRQLMRIAYLVHWPRSGGAVRGGTTDFYFLGHHKCASHWMRAFLARLAPLIRANYRVYAGVPHHEFRARWLERTIHVHVNSDPTTLDSVPEAARAFHVIRDPRDALVSDYFSRRDAHVVHNAWHAEMREYLRTHSMEEGLLYLMEQPSYLHQIAGWEIGSRPNVLDVRYEDLLADELGQFTRIVDHLGLRIDASTLAAVVSRCSFRSMSRGRRRGEENSRSQFRKGVAGDWRNHLPEGSPVHAAFESRFEGLVARLGYVP